MHWTTKTILLGAAAIGCAGEAGIHLEHQSPDYGSDAELPRRAPPGNLHLAASGSFIAGGPPIQIVATEDYGWHELVYLLRSNAGSGPGPCLSVFGGQCLDMQAPIGLQSTTFMDAEGTATFDLSFSPASHGREVCFQAAIPRGASGLASDLSNPLCQVVDLDEDGDGVGDATDACPGADDAMDADGDGTPDACDPCPDDVLDDSDGDGVCDTDDVCSDGDDTIDTDADGIPDDCEPTGACFSFTNTVHQDIALIGNDWFDACVDAQEDGQFMTITLQDGTGAVVYQSSGETVGDWTYDHITSDVAPWQQYYYDSHWSFVEMCDGSIVMITGKSANASGCNGSLGNGYGLTQYRDWSVGSTEVQLFVGSYLQESVDYAGTPRGFENWDPQKEILWDGGAIMDTCSDARMGFLGTIEIALTDEPPDDDGDGVSDCDDACTGFDDHTDTDGDGVADGCDPCPLDHPDDTDGDGVCDSDDACPLDRLDDSDGDGSCDSADVCPGFDDGLDADGDGIPNCLDACFSFTNTLGEDLRDDDWLDACVDAQSAGSTVTVILEDPFGAVVYLASGTTTSDWEQDYITSDENIAHQFNLDVHDWPVVLDDGNQLIITGKGAHYTVPSGHEPCVMSLGNGYGIRLVGGGSVDTLLESGVMMFVGSYVQPNEPWDIRQFPDWDPGREILWGWDSLMDVCIETYGFDGTFKLVVH